MKEMNGTARQVAMRRAGAGEDQLTIDNSRGLLADPVLLIHFLPRLYYSTHYPAVADVLCHSSSVSLSTVVLSAFCISSPSYLLLYKTTWPYEFLLHGIVHS